MESKIIFSVVFLSLIYLISSGGVVLSLEPLDQAQWLMEKGELDKVITLLEPLLDSFSQEELSQAVEMIYQIYLEKGEPDKATQVLEKYINKFPDDPSSYLYRYWIAKIEEERGNFAKALELFHKIIDSYPRDEEDPYGLKDLVKEDMAYNLQYHSKDYLGAIKVYQELLNSYPDVEEKARIMMEIASCYEKLGKIEEAISYYQKVAREAPDFSYGRWAELRIVYLQSQPTGVEKSKEALAQKLKEAFQSKDIKKLKNLAKKGDFWMGVMFSEFEVDDFYKVENYLSKHLPQSNNLQFGKLDKRNDDFVLRIDNWPDPDYNILYLLIEEGLYGWEWKGIIVSNTELENLQ
ncbi:MAG: hypothetical protein PWP57_224 [Candidatus Atribacteria bacterium]|nr:hypothetical protein [Candidatus Atribacteria bacterium]